MAEEEVEKVCTECHKTETQSHEVMQCYVSLNKPGQTSHKTATYFDQNVSTTNQRAKLDVSY